MLQVSIWGPKFAALLQGRIAGCERFQKCFPSQTENPCALPGLMFFLWISGLDSKNGSLAQGISRAGIHATDPPCPNSNYSHQWLHLSFLIWDSHHIFAPVLRHQQPLLALFHAGRLGKILGAIGAWCPPCDYGNGHLGEGVLEALEWSQWFWWFTIRRWV